jgi:hypothetical protein
VSGVIFVRTTRLADAAKKLRTSGMICVQGIYNAPSGCSSSVK